MDNKPVLIQCDHCESILLPKEITLDKTKLIGLTVEYFKCPRCGHVYVYKLTDSKQRMLDNQVVGYMEVLKSRKRHGKSISSAKEKKLHTLLISSKEYQMVLRDKHLQAVTEQLNKIGVTETNSLTGQKGESHEE